MANVRFELNSQGVRELLKSSGAMNVCKQHADRIRSRCGAGYEVTTYVGSTRANASVAAMTPEAKADNAKNNTLLKARGG